MTKRSASAVVFDLDGTLVDSRGDIIGACLHMLAQHGRPALPPETIAGFVGDGARLLVARASNLSPDDPALAPLLETYLTFYAAHNHDQTVLMTGAIETLEALSELPLALCTYKPRASTDPLLDHLDLRRRFRIVIAGEDIARHKPHPDPLLEIARRLGIPTPNIVMVGDGPQDVECGRRAGAITVGIPGPFLPRSRLLASRPDILLEQISQLPDAIRQRLGG